MPVMRRRTFTAIFRDADWLDASRIRLWGQAFAITFALLLGFDAWTHSSAGITDAKGELLGRDFINYWTGALLAADGRSALAYDTGFFTAFQKSYAGPAAEFRLYSYPPVAMLLSLPLALFPFLSALVLWTAAGILLCVRMLQTHLSPRMAWIAVLAAPASFWNVISGQNGFFTAALFAGGMFLLPRRPVPAGILLGMLCYKPQLGLLLPVALAAGGHWKSFFAAAATVIALVVASLAAFGPETWMAFLTQMRLQQDIFEAARWFRLPTVFGALRIAGVSVPLSHAAQVLSAIAAAVMVFKAWRRTSSPIEVRAAVLALGMFLATPYAWDYDLVILVFAAAWIAKDAGTNGFLPWEKFCWFLVIILPTPLMFLAQTAHFQSAPLVLWAAFALTFRRAVRVKRP